MIKYNTFADYQIIGTLPSTFADLIKIISTLVFPKNFALHYFSEDFSLISLDNTTTYKNLIKYAYENKITEVKFFATLFEIKNEDEIISGLGSMSLNMKRKNQIKNIQGLNVNETIKEIEEYSSTSKEAYSDDREEDYVNEKIEEYSSTSKEAYSDDREEDYVNEKPVNKIKFNKKEVKGKKISRDRKISSRNGKLERNYVYCC
jgi:hypothetical protein